MGVLVSYLIPTPKFETPHEDVCISGSKEYAINLFPNLNVPVFVCDPCFFAISFAFIPLKVKDIVILLGKGDLAVI